MRALIVDTETTGLDANKDAVIELAAALYDVDLREVVWCYASLVPGCTKNPVAAINGINDQLLAKSQDLPDPFSTVREVVDQADVIVAHNADFDRGMVKGRLGDKPWVCTVQQIRFPKATSACPTWRRSSRARSSRRPSTRHASATTSASRRRRAGSPGTPPRGAGRGACRSTRPKQRSVQPTTVRSPS